jgi:hypothetical protein
VRIRQLKLQVGTAFHYAAEMIETGRSAASFRA